MKMKKPSDSATLRASAQPGTSTFFSSSAVSPSMATLAEYRRARKPSAIAWPSVMQPRMIGQAIHLCCSEGRSSGSECVARVPSGLRMQMPQACRAHHDALEHSLAPDQGFLPALQSGQELDRCQKPQITTQRNHIDWMFADPEGSGNRWL